jgi:hypothetical protein
MAKGLFAVLKGIDAFGKVCLIGSEPRPYARMTFLTDNRGCEGQDPYWRVLYVLILLICGEQSTHCRLSK